MSIELTDAELVMLSAAAPREDRRLNLAPKPKGAAAPSAPRAGSKLARVIDLLRRDGGASIGELIAETGWLAHTMRAALTGLRRRGYAIAIDRSDDERGSAYRILTRRTDVAKAAAAPGDRGRAKSRSARKTSSRRGKRRARRSA